MVSGVGCLVRRMCIGMTWSFVHVGKAPVHTADWVVTIRHAVRMVAVGGSVDIKGRLSLGGESGT